MASRRPDSETSPAPVRHGLPVLPPVIAWVEIALLILPVAVYDYLAAGFTITELHPHPFWLPVLLLSLQYGAPSGLAAAGAAVIASFVLGWPEQDIGENHFTYLLRILAQPVLWIVAALLVGQFRLRQVEHQREMERQLSELSSQRAAIADYARNLRSRCEMLERHIASRRETARADALAGLARLATCDVSELDERFAATIEAVFDGASASLLERDGDKLKVISKVGWPSDAKWSTELTAASDLFSAVVIEGRALTVLDPADERDLAGEGLVVHPILSPTADSVLGAVKIERIDAENLDGDTASKLDAIGRMLAPVLSRRPAARLPARHPPGGATDVAAPQRSPTLVAAWRRLRWLPPGVDGPPDATGGEGPGSTTGSGGRL